MWIWISLGGLAILAGIVIFLAVKDYNKMPDFEDDGDDYDWL
jgi:hypothetical protein